MATASKTNIKDRIADNKLLKQILIDIVDSYIDNLDGPLDFENEVVFQVDGDNKLVINTDGSYAFYHSGVKKFEQDQHGNIGLQGASIPANVSTTTKHIFYPGDYTEFVTANFKVSMYNGYVNSSGDTVRINDSNSVSLEQYNSGSAQRYVSGPGSGAISFTQVYVQDFSTGDINIKTGGTYTATL